MRKGRVMEEMISTNDGVIDFLSQTEDLPSLPQVISHILDVMDDVRSSVSDVATAAEQDPAITAKILRIANSSYYAARKEITSVPYAIARMGQNEIRNMIISMGVITAMNKRGSGGLDYQRFWRHSLTVAIVARVINDFADVDGRPARRRENPFFVAGLLHDIGILVLDQNVDDLYASVVGHAAEHGQALHEVERRVLGATHQEVGRMLCEKWRLPRIVASAAAYHHEPFLAPEDDQRVVKVVHVADLLARQNGYGAYPVASVDHVQEAVMKELGLDQVDRSLLDSTIHEAAEQSSVYRILMDD
ncbi:MAG: HDOD domain-containing protein [Deltaproteobacteria bacterium]|nr:HDOD domain-containing protein [bacterium]MCB9476322.1 HDOD domain-containing protein [Deltaproteobacteria bacterium]MCB9489281.1 HDOD domain-containing protein [Deltaproteobacteria bacterium]